MKKREKKKTRWPDYELVKLPEGTITFGTSIFMRKDHKALKILFAAVQSVTFAPLDENGEEEKVETTKN